MISIIVAIGKNNEIGKDNGLLWKLKGDLKRFKELTMGKPVIMGQKTLESLPIKPLPNRINIVLTDDISYNYDGCIMKYSISESISEAKKHGGEIFIMGGGSIYRQFMKFADKLYITKVHEEFQDADVFFPDINENEWELVSQEDHYKDKYNEYDYSYLLYDRI